MLASVAVPLVQLPCGIFMFVLGLVEPIFHTVSEECLEFVNVVWGKWGVIVVEGAHWVRAFPHSV